MPFFKVTAYREVSQRFDFVVEAEDYEHVFEDDVGPVLDEYIGDQGDYVWNDIDGEPPYVDTVKEIPEEQGRRYNICKELHFTRPREDDEEQYIPVDPRQMALGFEEEK
jgi:hypothetical protein